MEIFTRHIYFSTSLFAFICLAFICTRSTVTAASADEASEEVAAQALTALDKMEICPTVSKPVLQETNVSRTGRQCCRIN